MAARMRKTHQDDVRAKIQASQLINRLMGHINGTVQLAPTQITSIKILLDKSLPNLSDVKIDSGAQGITFNLNANLPKNG
jgi:prolyl-tRNA editing enzyme YbaK/EbsC (Cys-tRNA(Pro) deacylase)